MDQQQAMLNDGSYNLAEIWQYSMNNGGGGGGGGGVGGGGGGINESGLGLGLMRGQFGQFSEVSGSDPVSVEQRRAGGVGGGGAHGAKKRRELDDDLNKVVSTSGGAPSNSNANANILNDGDGKRIKTSASKDENIRGSNAEAAEPSSGKPVDQNNKPPEPPKDYIHVRARRGQATDSHSLAERARREKISERMKILQDLVPGCNKVIGKALVLDEIINYIQSLQRQVEFLSMKLEAVNSRMNHGIEVFPPKDFGQQFDTTGMAFGSQPTREYNRGTSPDWLHMQVGGGFERPA